MENNLSTLELEKSVLGGVLCDNTPLHDIEGVLEPWHFSNASTQIVYDEMLKMLRNGTIIDELTLSQKLREISRLDKIGGSQFLKELISSGRGNVDKIPDYSDIIIRTSAVRDAVDLAAELRTLAFEGGVDNLSEIERVIGEMNEIGSSVTDHGSNRASIVADECIKELIQIKETGILPGVPMGFWELDQALYNMLPGELIIVAARPAMGKTAFALNVVNRVSKAGFPAALFSLEMDKKSLAKRLLVIKTGLHNDMVKRADLGDQSWEQLYHEMKSMDNIIIDDTAGLTVSRLRTKCKRLVRVYGVKAIFVDYIQLMTGTNKGNRQEDVSEISRGLKLIAKELNVPIVALSQLNRSLEARKDPQPKLSDLRESGAIEQDADKVLAIHRDAVFGAKQLMIDDNMYDAKYIASVLILKQRDGQIGNIPLMFTPYNMQFDDFHTPPGEKPRPAKQHALKFTSKIEEPEEEEEESDDLPF